MTPERRERMCSRLFAQSVQSIPSRLEGLVTVPLRDRGPSLLCQPPHRLEGREVRVVVEAEKGPLSLPPEVNLLDPPLAR